MEEFKQNLKAIKKRFNPKESCGEVLDGESWRLYEFIQTQPSPYSIRLTNSQLNLHHSIIYKLKNAQSPIFDVHEVVPSESNYFDLSEYPTQAVILFFFLIDDPSCLEIIYQEPFSSLLPSLLRLSHKYYEPLFDKLSVGLDYMLQDLSMLGESPLRSANFPLIRIPIATLIEVFALLVRFERPFMIEREILYYLPYSCYKIIPEISAMMENYVPIREVSHDKIREEWMMVDRLLWRTNDLEQLRAVEARRGYQSLIVKHNDRSYLPLTVVVSPNYRLTALEIELIDTKLGSCLVYLKKDVLYFPIELYPKLIYLLPKAGVMIPY